MLFTRHFVVEHCGRDRRIKYQCQFEAETGLLELLPEKGLLKPCSAHDSNSISLDLWNNTAHDCL